MHYGIRMLRHIILEGPDGSGKDTLMRHLIQEYHFVEHPRACTSEGGPVNRLDEWVIQDMEQIHVQNPSIYNRHPLISERIYAPIVRKSIPTGLLADDWWWRHYRKWMARYAMVIWCLPPLPVVRANVMRCSQMPGVVSNINSIYAAYKSAPLWPGQQIWYNYMSSLLAVDLTIERFMTNAQ